MRRIAGRLALLAAALVLGGTLTPAAELAKGAAMPAFELRGADGKTHTLDSLRGDGSLVLIVYRGVW